MWIVAVISEIRVPISSWLSGACADTGIMTTSGSSGSSSSVCRYLRSAPAAMVLATSLIVAPSTAVLIS